jgi:hypothetical protein
MKDFQTSAVTTADVLLMSAGQSMSLDHPCAASKESLDEGKSDA